MQSRREFFAGLAVLCGAAAAVPTAAKTLSVKTLPGASNYHNLVYEHWRNSRIRTRLGIVKVVSIVPGETSRYRVQVSGDDFDCSFETNSEWAICTIGQQIVVDLPA